MVGDAGVVKEERSLDAAAIYEQVWGVPPGAPQPWSHDDLIRDLDEPQEDPT